MDPWKKEEEMATEVSVTLKMQGRDMPWIVIRGSDLDEVRQMVAQVAGTEAGSLSLSDITHNANRHVQAVGTVGTVLGGSVVDEKADAPAPEPAAAEPAQEDGLMGQIKKAADKPALIALYTENAAAFKADQKLMDAMSAKSAEFAQKAAA